MLPTLHKVWDTPFDLLRDVSNKHPSVASIVLTGYGTVQSAVEALRLGAVDFLTKPIVNEDLDKALDRARRHQALLEENTRLRTHLARPIRPCLRLQSNGFHAPCDE